MSEGFPEPGEDDLFALDDDDDEDFLSEGGDERELDDDEPDFGE